MTPLPAETPARSPGSLEAAKGEHHPIRSFVFEMTTGVCVLALVLGIAGTPGTVSGNNRMDVTSGRAATGTTAYADRSGLPDPVLFGPDGMGRFLAGAFDSPDAVPAWTTPEGPLPRAQELLSILKTAANEGIDPRYYGTSVVESYLSSGSRDTLARAEALLNRAALDFALDRLLGQSRRNLSWEQKAALLKSEENLTMQELLHGLATSQDIGAYLASLAPADRQYTELGQALVRYRTAGNPEVSTRPVPEGRALRPGDRDPRVPLLRARLLPAQNGASGDSANSTVYDETLAEAVKVFQRSEGLTADGVLGPRTVDALNRGPGQKIARLELALERWRLLPRQLGPVHVLVNVPQFELFLEDGNTTALRMKVAVGSPGRHATPLFSDAIRYMEFNPYWNVPPSIARSETVPKQRNDPDYMQKRGYSVVTSSGESVSPDDIDWSNPDDVARNYRIRQSPGPGNALGSVKFMFPNRYSVYLHDTNAPGVFQRENRAVSHGCVRVSNPKGLADYILSHLTTARTRTFESFRGPSPRRVDLTTPLPIHLVYITAWAEENGEVRFFSDIYRQDTGLASRLEETSRNFSPPWKEASNVVREARTEHRERLSALPALRDNGL